MIKTPQKTSVYKKEPQHKEKNVFGFAPELINFILKGHKVITYKYGYKKDYLNVGDNVYIKNSKTGKVIDQAYILKKENSTFIKLPLNARGHESCENKEQQRKVLSGYYAYLGRPIKDSDPFLIFEFQLIK